ncbi:glutamine amidotransferase class-I [Citreicella sp. 357]|nr:glutamine amidotransferase class-I [Citreicella sp. 357]
MRFLVLQHEPLEHPAAFRPLIEAAGHTRFAVHLNEGDTLPQLDGYDALGVMGRPMDVWQEEAFSWPPPKRHISAKRWWRATCRFWRLPWPSAGARARFLCRSTSRSNSAPCAAGRRSRNTTLPSPPIGPAAVQRLQSQVVEGLPCLNTAARQIFDNWGRQRRIPNALQGND